MHIDETPLNETHDSEAVEQSVAEQAKSEIANESLADGEGDGDEDESSKQSKIQKRINEITKARREAERERDFWRMQAQQKAQEAPSAVQLQKPTLDQFDYDQEAYLEALADWKVQTTIAKTMADHEKAQSSQANQQSDREFAMREYEVEGEFPDYRQKVYANDVPITDTMAQAIRTDENGARVAYFLATYKDIAYRVANLSPREQFLAIGEISEKISQAKASEGQQRPVTNAPAPVPSVSSRGSVVNKNPDKMSTDEFMAWRNKQLQNRK
jgi:hypothetical protein